MYFYVTNFILYIFISLNAKNIFYYCYNLNIFCIIVQTSLQLKLKKIKYFILLINFAVSQYTKISF